jgi:hypothetical protein
MAVKKISPTQRSLKALREDGWTVEVVERWNPYARIRQDLFNFIDMVAIKPGHPITGIQVTAAGASSRVRKIRAEPAAPLWLLAGGSLLVHSWAKRGPRGKRKVYQCRVIDITMNFFAEEKKTNE